MRALDASYALSPSACGGLGLELAGEAVLLRASGALWIREARALVVADLHLEKGSAFAARGQMLPPYDSRDALARLSAEAAELAPRAIVFLGDSFHDEDGDGRMAEEDLEALGALARAAELVWILGNHDSGIAKRLPGAHADALKLGRLRLVHEPSRTPLSGEAAGHLHPCARVKGQAGSVRRRCFVTDGERLVLPAFGAFAGGLNVKHPALATLFARRPLAVALGARRAHPVAWDRLGGD
jgi:DNA ligase-associated metallophosphoesterase